MTNPIKWVLFWSELQSSNKIKYVNSSTKQLKYKRNT